MENSTKLSYLDKLIDKLMTLGIMLIIFGVFAAVYVIFTSDVQGLIKSII